MKVTSDSVKKLRRGLIVSCQAAAGEPLYAPEHISALALSAINGGAIGLRLEGVENVACMRSRTALPLVALSKDESIPESQRMGKVYITPTFADAQRLAEAGADIIALDATERERPDGSSVGQMIMHIHSELHKPVWADVATYEEGIAAAAAGADVISTTLSGYTEDTKARAGAGPDIELVARLAKELPVPIVLEGQVWTPEEVTKAFGVGAYAVVVGSAITRPQLITQRFVKAIPAEK